jgi:hypothetical protein
MREKRNVYRLLVGKAEGKCRLGRPRLKFLDNNKNEALEKELGDVDWIGLAQYRYSWRAVMKAIMDRRVP